MDNSLINPGNGDIVSYEHIGKVLKIKENIPGINYLKTVSDIIRCVDVGSIIKNIKREIEYVVQIPEEFREGFEEGKYQGIGNTMASILLLVFILIAIFTDLGIYGISIAYVLSHLVVLIYEYLAFKRHIVVPKFEFDKSFCKEITILSIPFAATGILYSIYYSMLC